MCSTKAPGALFVLVPLYLRHQIAASDPKMYKQHFLILCLGIDSQNRNGSMQLNGACVEPYFSLQPMTLPSLSKPAFRIPKDDGTALRARAINSIKAPWPISICRPLVSVAVHTSVRPSATSQAQQAARQADWYKFPDYCVQLFESASSNGEGFPNPIADGACAQLEQSQIPRTRSVPGYGVSRPAA